jgi:hypothetical protein
LYSSPNQGESDDANAFDAKGVSKVHVRKLSDDTAKKTSSSNPDDTTSEAPYTMIYEGHGAGMK